MLWALLDEVFMASVNRYKADLRELQFVLLEQFGFAEVVKRAPFENWGPDEAKAVLEETYRFARDVLGPLNASGDREGCRLEAGQVRTPAGFKDAWTQLWETGFKTISAPVEHGGQDAPQMMHVLVEEILSGANTAFNLYPALASGAGELLMACALPEQIKRYATHMLSGKWGGTMCLTEPHAGSDVGAAKTSAKKRPDGRYDIRGTKIFISGGDHDLAENIIHLVLARIEGAPAGTKGLSLMIVPKRQILPDGGVGPSNDVSVASIEHKMGINGSATAVLNFGEAGTCAGELVGAVEHQGMSQMFRMMNSARIAVGVQGLAVASTAYLNALDYAKERRQGANFRFWKDPAKPRVPILDHADVRRMLLDLKCHVEGIRALVVKLASHVDRARQAAGTDDEKAAYHRGQVELLTPLVKSYSSEEGYRLCAVALQVFGGAGYLKDHPIEQCCRDSKIFSIYEGTTHIQAMDLVGRKMGQAGGAHFQQFLGDITGFVDANRSHRVFAKEIATLATAQESVMQAAMGFLGWSQDPQKLQLVPLAANRFQWMMSELAVGWLLLEAGVIADKALAGKPSEADRAFYEGKKASALWYARNVLPEVKHLGEVIAREDASPVEIPDAAFASV
jgi:alkylation response protein AidB-like acyl-CoA dehydrogenase